MVWLVQVGFIRTLSSDFIRVCARAASLINGLENVTLPQVLFFFFSYRVLNAYLVSCGKPAIAYSSHYAEAAGCFKQSKQTQKVITTPLCVKTGADTGLDCAMEGKRS